MTQLIFSTAETWWIDGLVRHPVLISYSFGEKRLDRVYLDTTFADQRETHRRFPSKADGLKELLFKVARYPNDTVFHFHAWTFGYEDVWIALSSALKSQVGLKFSSTYSFSSRLTISDPRR